MARRAANGATRALAGAGLAAQRDRLHQVIEPVVRAGGYDLEELRVSRAGRRGVVRVVVDGDGGVGLDAVADLSREISAALDAAESAHGEFAPGEYVLEVGSPGVDRPLTQPRHWRRNLGRLVRVRAAGRAVTGRIRAVDAHGVVLGSTAGPVGYRYEQLGPGHVQVEFDRLDEIAEDDLTEFGDEAGEFGDDAELEDEE